MTDEIDIDSLITKYNARQDQFNAKGKLIASKWNFPNIGELIFNEFGYHFLTVIDSKEKYAYNGGYYEPNAETIINDWVEKIQGEDTTEHSKKEVNGYIRDKNYQKREIFNAKPHLLNLKNGIYDINTNILALHTSDQYFLSQHPILYNPEAKINTIKTFFEQVLRPEDIPLVQEIFGYTLLRNHPIQKAFMFIGDGANGKSVSLSLLKTFLGKENTCAISLQDIVRFRFAAATLYGKMANIYPDIADEALHKTGMFKILTGGDMVTAEQKFKDPFSFTNYAKLIFSANKLPEVHDDTDAFFRRWIFVTFPNKFEGSNANKNLIEKLTTEEEISGLFNWSIEGLKRLLAAGDFTNTKTTDEMREMYQRLASPIKAFVDDCLDIDVNNFISKDELYSAFCKYCSDGNLPIVAKNVFSMRLHEYVHVSEYRPEIDGKRIQSWRGICLKENASYVNPVNPVNPFPVLKQENLSQVYIRLEKNPDSPDSPDTSRATEED